MIACEPNRVNACSRIGCKESVTWICPENVVADGCNTGMCRRHGKRTLEEAVDQVLIEGRDIDHEGGGDVDLDEVGNEDDHAVVGDDQLDYDAEDLAMAEHYCGDVVPMEEIPAATDGRDFQFSNSVRGHYLINDYLRAMHRVTISRTTPLRAKMLFQSMFSALPQTSLPFRLECCLICLCFRIIQLLR